MLQPYGPSSARLMIVADCVSYRDLQSKTILNDREFDRMLSDAGVFRQHCFVTALLRDQVHGQSFDTQIAQKKSAITPNHKALFNHHVLPPVMDGLARLVVDIDLVKPKIILVLGNGPLLALTGKYGIKSWRSSILEYTSPGGHRCHIIPTYTPQYIQSQWKDRPLAVHDIRKAHSLSRLDVDITPPDYKFIIEPDFGTAASTLTTLRNRLADDKLKLSVDIETRGGHIACTGIAWSDTEAICIPHLRAVVQEMPNWESKIHYWGEAEEAYLLYLLYQVLTHPNAEIVGQNFIYDAQYFYRHFHFTPRFVRDTMLSQHSMFSDMPKGLDVLSSLHCSHHVYWKDESKNWNPKLGERQLWLYNCMDCVRTYEIDTSQQSAIAAMSDQWPKLPSVVAFQQSMFYPVLDTMNRGLRVNHESKSALSDELLSAIETKNRWISSALGFDLNIKSPKQMQDLFYRLLGQPEIRKRSKKGASVTTDDAALEKIAVREPLLSPLCSTIRDLRSLGVFRSTFLEAPTDHDDRMRCSFNIAGTSTYRFSSSENAFGSGMNLQNIPKGDESSGLPNVRKLFIPDPGYEFFDIDLDSADLRIVVWESNCREMKAMFAEGLKPYVEIAKEYFRDPSITKHHPSYKTFKALAHATNYLGTPSGIAGRIGLEVNEVDRIMKWYYGKFPEIKTWQENLTSTATRNRYVENVFGYRYYIFDRLEGNVINQVVAWIPQSTVGCLINRGYKNIYKKEKDIQVLLQVHDSLAGQFPSSQREESLKKIVEHCSVPLPYEEPLIIPVGIVSSPISWGACG